MDMVVDLGLHTAMGWAVFTAVFYITRTQIWPGGTLKLANRFVSGLHAVLMIALGCLAVHHGYVSWDRIGGPTAEPLAKLLCISLGYFIYDLLCCWYIEYITKIPDLANTAHHTVCTLGLIVAIFFGKSGAEVMACVLLAEISTPFLHARFILKELGSCKKSLMTLVEVLFAATFFLFRVVVGPFLTWKTLMTPQGSLVVKVCGLGVQVVSFLWFWKILSIGLGRYNRPKAV